METHQNLELDLSYGKNVINENFLKSKNNQKRSSLRNIKNWMPFNDNSNPNTHDFVTPKDDFINRPTGIVKRMVSSISNQILSSNLARSKSNLSTKIDDENIYSNSKVKIKLSNKAKLINNSNSNTFEFMGNFNVEETENGIKINLKQPHLISVQLKSNIDANREDTENKNSKANKTSIKIYPLKVGRTSIGSSNTNDIVLNGHGIEPHHCFIENNLNTLSHTEKINTLNDNNFKQIKTQFQQRFIRSSSKESCSTICNQVTLYPLAKLCAIDGVLIQDHINLNSGKFFF